MALSAEQTFIMTVVAAEGVRQQSKAAAFTTYAFVQANLAAYVAAILAADVAYTTAVNNAASTAGSLKGNTLGVAGQGGPIAGFTATVASPLQT
jgi:hypothetical protein